MIGTSLSHYRIVEKLGSGGMGEVYVAEDTKLSRRVALKVLPPEMAENAERRARFEREAKAVAALDHPNIVTIHSVEEAEGVHFYTMQLVKGKTLTELISKKGMSLNKFFEIAIPLADAVSAAHEQGIIHRDLKPDNLMVSDEGRLKILDFGLAKLKPQYAEEGASELPTQSATAEGRIVGTVAYMSPEQAEGKQIDNRSDIFSIGIILYEMATGERPFKGDTAASLLSSIIKDTPQSATEVNPNIPRDLGKIIRRCLVKDTEHRYQTAKDLRNELEELKQEVDSGEALEGLTTATVRPKTKWHIHIALVVAVVLAGILGYQLRLGEVPEETAELHLRGTFTRLTSLPGNELDPAPSPDGEFFVYSGGDASGNYDIYLQRVGGEKAINLTESSAEDDFTPAYSPDGRYIAFRSERDGGGIFLMGATGESVRRLTDFGFNPTWSPDGEEIAFATHETIWDRRAGESQVWAVRARSGEKRLVTKEDAVDPSWSPNGHRIAFCSIYRDGNREIYTLPATGGEATAVTQDAQRDEHPVWSPDGKYLYFSSNRGGSTALWRVRIDEASGRALDVPQPVTSGGTASRHSAGFSKDGERIAYVEEVTSLNLEKIAFNPERAVIEGQPIPITRGPSQLWLPDVSPDGTWLTYMEGFPHRDIAIMRQDGTERRRLMNDVPADLYPRWSPDGKKIAFHSHKGSSTEIYIINPDGSGRKQITDMAGQSLYFPTWSPSGSRMAYVNGTERASYIFDPNVPWHAQIPERLPPLGDGENSFWVFSWSPNGRWLAGFARGAEWTPHGVVIYSHETGEYQKLTEYGGYPEWLSDSRRLLFWHQGAIFVVDVETRDVREVFRPTPGGARNAVSLSPDNRWLYFAHWVRQADIWMLTLNEE
jgi:Tol biopolymer transport system component/serine/threonine protein kinase